MRRTNNKFKKFVYAIQESSSLPNSNINVYKRYVFFALIMVMYVEKLSRVKMATWFWDGNAELLRHKSVTILFLVSFRGSNKDTFLSICTVATADKSMCKCSHIDGETSENIHFEDRKRNRRITLRRSLGYDDGRWMELAQNRVQW
jgi:hypothetical protein